MVGIMAGTHQKRCQLLVVQVGIAAARYHSVRPAEERQSRRKECFNEYNNWSRSLAPAELNLFLPRPIDLPNMDDAALRAYQILFQTASSSRLRNIPAQQVLLAHCVSQKLLG